MSSDLETVAPELTEQQSVDTEEQIESDADSVKRSDDVHSPSSSHTQHITSKLLGKKGGRWKTFLKLNEVDFVVENAFLMCHKATDYSLSKEKSKEEKDEREKKKTVGRNGNLFLTNKRLFFDANFGIRRTMFLSDIDRVGRAVAGKIVKKKCLVVVMKDLMPDEGLNYGWSPGQTLLFEVKNVDDWFNAVKMLNGTTNDSELKEVIQNITMGEIIKEIGRNDEHGSYAFSMTSDAVSAKKAANALPIPVKTHQRRFSEGGFKFKTSDVSESELSDYDETMSLSRHPINLTGIGKYTSDSELPPSPLSKHHRALTASSAFAPGPAQILVEDTSFPSSPNSTPPLVTSPLPTPAGPPSVSGSPSLSTKSDFGVAQPLAEKVVLPFISPHPHTEIVGDCNCLEHYTHPIADEEVPIALGDLAPFVFGNETQMPSFTTKFLRSLRCTEVNFSQWIAGGPDGSFTRQLRYRMPYKNPMKAGEQVTRVHKSQFLLYHDPKRCVVDMRTISLDVPYASSFAVKERLCLTAIRGNLTRVVVRMQLEWLKSCWVKPFITTNTVDNMKEFYKGWLRDLRASHLWGQEGAPVPGVGVGVGEGTVADIGLPPSLPRPAAAAASSAVSAINALSRTATAELDTLLPIMDEEAEHYPISGIVIPTLCTATLPLRVRRPAAKQPPLPPDGLPEPVVFQVANNISVETVPSRLEVSGGVRALRLSRMTFVLSRHTVFLLCFLVLWGLWLLWNSSDLREQIDHLEFELDHYKSVLSEFISLKQTEKTPIPTPSPFVD